ncbi:hypothetical protein [Fodinicurvata sp. EGI_FJ10296]|uniref:hypothetical protein n=1 Tax=Fodinicurvata sp. EGI_FJ10296 TaxID=3231908 RepID=UPI0034528F9C
MDPHIREDRSDGRHAAIKHRPVRRTAIAGFLAGTAAALTPLPLTASDADAGEPAEAAFDPLEGWLVNASTHLRSRVHGLRDNADINPDGAIFDTESHIQEAVGRIVLERPGDAFLTIGLRPKLTYDDIDRWSARLNIDEAYVDVMATPEAFLFAGLKRTVSGVANGFNPTDFLNAGKESDGLLRDDDRRAEIAGDIVAGVEYFTTSGTVTAAVLPEIEQVQETPTRLYLDYQGTFETIDADFSVNAVVGHSSALGYNLSATLGRATILYSEGALHFRRGRDRLSTATVNGQPVTFPDSADGDRVYPEIVVGATYTFENGITLNGEFYHDARGYSDSEFDDIAALIDRAAPAFRAGGPAAASAAGQLGLAAGAAFESPLRRNYLFARLSDIAIGSDFDLSLVGIHNLDDSSSSARARLTYEPTSADRFELVGEVFAGSDRSEFGLIPFSERAMLTYRRLF